MNNDEPNYTWRICPECKGERPSIPGGRVECDHCYGNGEVYREWDEDEEVRSKLELRIVSLDTTAIAQFAKLEADRDVWVERAEKHRQDLAVAVGLEPEGAWCVSMAALRHAMAELAERRASDFGFIDCEVWGFDLASFDKHITENGGNVILNGLDLSPRGTLKRIKAELVAAEERILELTGESK